MDVNGIVESERDLTWYPILDLEKVTHGLWMLIIDGIMEYELDYDLTLTVLDLLMIFGWFSQMMWGSNRFKCNCTCAKYMAPVQNM